MKTYFTLFKAVLAALGLFSVFFLSDLSGAENAAGKPRAVTPRGELGAEEKAIIHLFDHAKDSVVFISTSEQIGRAHV